MFVRSSISAGRRAVPKSRARARIAYCCRDAKRTARDETRANVRNGSKADITRVSGKRFGAVKVGCSGVGEATASAEFPVRSAVHF